MAVTFVNCTQYGVLVDDARYTFDGTEYLSAHIYRNVDAQFQQVTLTVKNPPSQPWEGVYVFGDQGVTLTNRAITWTGPALVNGVYVLSATDSGPALDPGNTDQVIRDEDAVTGGVTLKFTQKPKEDEEENN